MLFSKSGDQIKAVNFFRNKHEYIIKARKEVILAAGAFESPKLLMLSGIGPEKHLKENNIDVVKVKEFLFDTIVGARENFEFGGKQYNFSMGNFNTCFVLQSYYWVSYTSKTKLQR